MVVSAEFVDFIQNKKRITRTTLFDVLQHASWHGADVRLSMTTDFRFVAKPSKTHADVFSTQSLRNASAK